jgi:YfiR/HmsC-like
MLHRCARRAHARLALAALALGLWAAPLGAAPDDYGTKAAFLLNFAKLVRWPDGAAPAAGAPLVIGVAGEPGVVASIASGLEGARLRDHPIEVRALSGPDEIGGCQIVFATGSDPEAAAAWSLAARGSGALLVGEASGFAASGGAINFFVENDRLRFEINPRAADREGLKISSRLLRLARLVDAPE